MELLLRLGVTAGVLLFLSYQVPQLRMAIWSILAPFVWLGLFVLSVVALVWFIRLRNRRHEEELNFQPRSFGNNLTPLVPEKAVPSAPSSLTLADRLGRIDWFQFEKLIALLYQARGYSVTRRGGAQPDGGVDLLATKQGELTVVQCKHWRDSLVKPDKVREVIGAKSIEKAGRASLVTLRGFTQASRQLADEQGVELIEEAQLVAWLGELQHSPAWPEIERALDETNKTCPRCESQLVVRTAGKGSLEGRSFWGCSTYPRCNFTFNEGLPQ